MPPIASEYMLNEHDINHEWKEYYLTLEAIRQSGITNMWGASPYLAEIAGIDHKLAQKVLCSWIKNYSEIKKCYFPGDLKLYTKINTEDIWED